MQIFNANNITRDQSNLAIYAYSQIAYTLVDALASLCFIIGSALFFFASTTYQATWLFLIGSIFFGVRPLITLTREFMYLSKEKKAKTN